MARRTVRDETPDAESAGSQYAQAQLEGDYFLDWVREQLAEAADMQDRGEDMLPLENKQDALVVAKNMLQQLEWDTKKGLDESELGRLAGVESVSRETHNEFYKGFREALDSSRDWLADELLRLKEEMRGGGTVEARRSGTAQRGPTQKHMYVWQVSLQVTSPDRPALRHQIQYRVQALSNEKDVAVQQAKELATRDGHTVVDVLGATKGYKVTAEGHSVRARNPEPVEDPEYVIQGLYKDGDTIVESFGFDDEDTARSEAWKLSKSPYFEGDYVRIITRDSELVWDSRGNSKGKGPRVRATNSRDAGYHVMTWGGGVYTSVGWYPTKQEAEKEVARIKASGRWSGKPPKIEPARPRPVVRDYAAVDSRDRVIAGPFKHHHEAQKHAGTGGHVKFVPKPRPATREGRRSPKARRSVRRPR